MRFKMNPTSTARPANKLLGLEVLRFLAAFAILVFHYRHFAFVAHPFPPGLHFSNETARSPWNSAVYQPVALVFSGSTSKHFMETHMNPRGLIPGSSCIIALGGPSQYGSEYRFINLVILPVLPA